MSETRANIIEYVKDMAQDPLNAPFLADNDGYDRAIDSALAEFSTDVPNERIVHYSVSSAGFRFVLAGTGAILSGQDAWTRGKSLMNAVWCPYDTSLQQRVPLDSEAWRVSDEPDGVTVLELVEDTAASGNVMRLEFVSPHVIGAAAEDTSIRSADLDAFYLLGAAFVLEMFAAKSVQNTGQSGFPADIVDRRTPSDQAASRAKMFRERYGKLVGRAGKDSTARPLSSVGDYDIRSSHAHGFLFKTRRQH